MGDIELLMELQRSSQSWETAHRHILAYLLASHVGKIAVDSGDDFDVAMDQQINIIQKALPSTMDEDVRLEVSANIYVMGSDARRLTSRNKRPAKKRKT